MLYADDGSGTQLPVGTVQGAHVPARGRHGPRGTGAHITSDDSAQSSENKDGVCGTGTLTGFVLF